MPSFLARLRSAPVTAPVTTAPAVRPSASALPLDLTEPWDRLAALTISRASPRLDLYPLAPLDRGVNFFVIAIEMLGGSTQFSCEGHPHHFYLSARMPARLARQIAGCGFLIVALDRGDDDDRYRLSFPTHQDQPHTMARHHQLLRSTAAAWIARLPLDVEAMVAAAHASPDAPVPTPGDLVGVAAGASGSAA